jgi:hypothetical protein
MIDSRLIRKVSGVVIALSLVCLSAACGGNGAANNDQGMSVTFLGLFSSNRLTGSTGGTGGGDQTSGATGCGQLPAAVSGGSMRLGEAQPEPGADPSTPVVNGTDASGGFVSVVGVQNNLYGQAFRAERLLIDFYIPGASVQPPSTNVPMFIIAGPADSASQGNGSGTTGVSVQNPGLRRPQFTSLPPSFSNVCNRSLAQVTVIPSAIREWLNFNRDALPEAPFKMEVTLRVNGISSSGNRYETNDGTFDFEILPETFIEPTAGDGGDAPTAVPTSAGVLDENGAGGVGGLERLFEAR